MVLQRTLRLYLGLVGEHCDQLVTSATNLGGENKSTNATFAVGILGVLRREQLLSLRKE